ncbi:TPA: Uma2 family endonuclease [Candidatus Poribacteria bacterium]|nr:Uma2 family endonuclease [Candidatus Poribacteria bacterium]
MSQEVKNEPLAAPTVPSLAKKMTYEEFLAWLDEDIHAEWVNGEVVFMSPISGEHQDVGGFLLALIWHFVEAHQLGVIRYDPFQMKTGPDLPGRAPDILFVANENLSRLKRTHLEGPADLVVEIISPDSRGRDRGDKFYEYEQGGVREYWLIDPLRKQAEFYRLGEDGIYRFVPIGDDGIFRSSVLEGLWLKVDWLWQTPLPLSVLREWKLV